MGNQKKLLNIEKKDRDELKKIGVRFSSEDFKSLNIFFSEIDVVESEYLMAIEKGELNDKLILTIYDIRVLTIVTKIIKMFEKYNSKPKIFNNIMLDLFDEAFKKYIRSEEFNLYSQTNHKSKFMYISSMFYYFSRRTNRGLGVNKDDLYEPKEGQMYFANLLLGYDNELSYIHPVIIVKVDEDNKNIICVPCSSSKVDDFEKAEKKIDSRDQIIINKKYTGKDEHTIVFFKEIHTLKFRRLTRTTPYVDFNDSENSEKEKLIGFYNLLKMKVQEHLNL
jgi:hypothetical protein